ncbi:hypothetical protein G6F43_001226 [Rhizopus delemar]|nr:hypothetical protein G6F43_001226 [Rhizopus delemar]
MLLCFCTCTQGKNQNNDYLNAIFRYDVVKLKVKRSRAPVPLKKRKGAGGAQAVENTKRGAVTGLYFNSIANTFDIFDQHEQIKNIYIVMDNAPVHKNADIKKYWAAWLRLCLSSGLLL